MKITCQTWTIEVRKVRSLVWAGDSLIDWAAGGTRFDLDGSTNDPHVHYAYRFDAACSSPSGEYAVLYERLGTKGIVLHRGEVLREINRSFYCANAYEYPVVIVRVASGREVLVHCPEDYNRLEIDDVATGERLTAAENRKPRDFFHSRLATDGRFLLSAGWIWHPVDAIGVYRLDDALADARYLDGLGCFSGPGTEVNSAALLWDGRIVVGTSDETFLEEADLIKPDVLRPESLAVFDTNEGRILSQVPLQEPVGTMMKLGQECVVGFFEHPKVFDLATGRVIWRMRELKTGKQASSIIDPREALPPLALDPAGGRFAVATEEGIRVVKLLQ